jgi:hypothetical protein
MAGQAGRRLYSPGALEAAMAAKEEILRDQRSHHLQRLFGGLAVLLSLLVFPTPARAGELYTYTVGVLGGLGGSFDVDTGDGFNNSGYQLNLSLVTEPRTQVAFRLGKLNLDHEELFGSLSGADLSYITVGGEYRFQETYYDSGIYLGLGGYRLRGTRFNGQDDESTSVGLNIGVTAEFPINRWLGILVEASGHYVDLDEAKIFGMAHGGVAFHF